MKILITILTLVVLSACSKDQSPNPKTDIKLIQNLSLSSSSQRVIVTSDNLDQVRNELNQNEVTQINKQQSSFELTVVQAKNLKQKFPNLKLEEDVIFSIPPVKELAKSSGAPVIQPDQTITWGITAVKASSASNRGLGVKVCVIDTGIDKTHPDLNSNKIQALGVPGLRNKSNDDNGHGTHVSGTIAAQDSAIGVVGVSPDVNLISVKALNRQGSGYSSDLANAIDLCVSQGARVINASWGSATNSSVISSAVLRAYNAGVYFVAAAGNESGSVSYPGALSQSIAISAVDSSMNFANFSNYGIQVDYTAPGVDVLSTLPGGKYASWNGTSMATPHAVGVIAIMLGAGKNIIGSTLLNLSTVQQGQGLVNAEISSY